MRAAACETDDDADDADDADELLDAQLTAPQALAAARPPAPHLRALNRLAHGIELLAANELLRALRAAAPDARSLQRVRGALHTLPPEAATHHHLPLLFVDGTRALTLLDELLLSRRFIAVRRVDDTYFVTGAADDAADDAVGRGDAGDDEGGDDDDAGAPPYWAVLHLSPPELASPSPDAPPSTARCTLHVALHHPPGTPWHSRRVQILETLCEGVERACREVNQRILLAQLNETRAASELLIPVPDATASSAGANAVGAVDGEEAPASGAHDTSSLGSEGQDAVRDGAALPAAFAPGEFACPLKFTVAFALNHRLKPANVVHALSSSVLDPFAINNRSHCYVYRDRLGHVFYMRLDARVSEGRPGAPAAAAAGGDGASTASGSAGSGGGAAAGGGGDEIEIALGAAVGGEETEIALRVWGVHDVSDEIAVELHRLLKTRVNELGHQVLARLLARNPQLALTPADLDFISAARDGAPLARGETHRHAAYVLPASVRDPFVLLLQLRQNICQSTFISHAHFAASARLECRSIRNRRAARAPPRRERLVRTTGVRHVLAPSGVVR